MALFLKPGLAHEFKPGDLTIGHPHAFPSPGRTAAGYLTITNGRRPAGGAGLRDGGRGCGGLQGRYPRGGDAAGDTQEQPPARTRR